MLQSYRKYSIFIKALQLDAYIDIQYGLMLPCIFLHVYMSQSRTKTSEQKSQIKGIRIAKKNNTEGMTPRL